MQTNQVINFHGTYIRKEHIGSLVKFKFVHGLNSAYDWGEWVCGVVSYSQLEQEIVILTIYCDRVFKYYPLRSYYVYNDDMKLVYQGYIINELYLPEII